jgi:hypothetical protein
MLNSLIVKKSPIKKKKVMKKSKTIGCVSTGRGDLK